MKRSFSVPNTFKGNRPVKLYVKVGSTLHYKRTYRNMAEASAAVAGDAFRIGRAGTYVLQEQ